MAFSSKKSKQIQASFKKMAEEMTFSERPDKTFNVRLYNYLLNTNGNFAVELETAPRIAVNQPENARGPAVIKLPEPPAHKFNEELQIFVEDSGGEPIHLI